MDRHPYRVRITLALLLIGGAVLAGGASSSTPATATHGSAPAGTRGTLVLGLQQEPDLLNPIVTRMRSANYVAQMIFSYLARTDETGRLVPDLLEAIPDVENGGISADGRTITYRLRRDARWHDGEAVTSRDVRFTYARIVDPDSGAATRHGWEGVEAVETPDRWTVVFRLDRARPAFVGDAFVDEPVLPAHLLENLPGDAFRHAPYHRNPVGSGPFQVETWESGDRLVLRAFRDHHGEGPYLDRIVLRFVPDPAALEAQLTTGEVDGFDNAETLVAERLDRMPGVVVHRTPGAVYEHMDMNCQRTPLDDARVRRAIMLAIDRQQISEAVYDGHWPPAYADEPATSPFYEPSLEQLVSLDRARSRALLTEAGWRDADGNGVRERDGEKLSLTLTTTAGRPDRERVALLLRDQLRQVGVGLEIRLVESTLFFSSAEDGGILLGGDFDLALFAWSAPPDPGVKEAIYSSDFLPPKGQNVTRLQDDRLTELLREAGLQVEPAVRERMYRESALRVAELAPSVPLVWRTQIDTMRSTVRNFRPNPTTSGNSWNVAEWWLEPSG